MDSHKRDMLMLYRHQRPDSIIPYAAACKTVVMPGDRFFGGPGGEDAWGVHWTNLGPDPSLDGSTPTPGKAMLTDIARWREQVRFPDYSKMPLQEIFSGMTAGINRDRMVVHGLMLSGTFERMHNLMGMEDAMCAFYENPEAVHELIGAIADNRIEAINQMIRYVNPDVIHMHDDWGMENNMLISPDIWRTFIKPVEKRYAQHIHTHGKVYEHHSCGYITPIVDELVEIGIDALNPVDQKNDVEGILRKHGKHLLVLGGLSGRYIDNAETSEEQVRLHVRDAIDRFAPLGLYSPGYIPTSRQKSDIVSDEALKYGKHYYV